VFAARSISAFGTGMTPVAVPFAVLQDLGGSPRQLGAVVATGAVAQILVQLFGGALADRGSRQRQMVSADLLAALAQAAFAALLLCGAASVAAAIALSALVGVAFALHWPAAVGLVPLVAPRDRLQPANALLAIAHSTALGLGAAVGGVLVATAGAGTALAIDAGSFAASALLVAGVRAAPQARSAVTSLLSELREGFAEFIRHRWLWTIVLQFTVMTMGWFGTYSVVGPIVAKEALAGAGAWGAIAAGHGFGLVAGGILMLRMRFDRPMLAATLACFGNALLPLLLFAPAPLVAIVLGAFAIGVAQEVFNVLWNTALHTRVDPAALSRVSAYDVVGSIALVPLGQLAAGLSVEAFGAPPTLLAAAAAIVLPTALVLLVPEVRHLRNAK
jgi:MFS family permease